ncbi:MAG: bifunctional homocysteine S-methyltransferase/methylenetetrahydrofolate reductase [Eubacteriales bacterium]|nr:bifunctional homocysteine S-methyltransferase/methylenetetrahydrofolate reductase [Eubacteriales bacterium]
MNIRDELKREPVLFDGGMGSYFAAREHETGQGCERASIDEPMLISAIHREYLEVGARAIKTNTFAANSCNYPRELVDRILRASWNLAVKAAESYDAAVFADIGPVSGLSPQATREEYRFLVDKFLELGAKNFLFETQQDEEGLKEAAERIREAEPEAFIIVSFAIGPDGFTRSGVYAEDLLKDLTGSGLFDAAGCNCVIGVRQMQMAIEDMDLHGVTLSVMPNSGQPVVIENRTFFDSDPVYFGKGIASLYESGVRILGGCCGTTPRHIAEARKALDEAIAENESGERAEAGSAGADIGYTEPLSGGESPDEGIVRESAFFRKLAAGGKPFAVELDPPDHGGLRTYMEDAAKLDAAGADIITIADCPGARARMDSSLLACMIQEEVGGEAVPHITCRDRNINASKALLLGLSAAGVRNVLVVTGDTIPTAKRDEVKSVYEFNSRRMAAFVRTLGEKSLAAPFHIFGALNVNAVNFRSQLAIAKQKLDMGMCGFMTQPVLSKEAVDNLKAAREGLPGAYIMGGILPPVSERNCVFMENEMSGIHLAPEIIAAYRGLDKAPAEKLALEISLRAAREIGPYVDGFYLMTPFRRVSLMADIMDGIREQRETGTLSSWIDSHDVDNEDKA